MQYLLDHFTKDKHNLTASIVYPVDRQNIEQSVVRICDEKVINLMRSSVIGSQATAKLLEIMKRIMDSHANNNLEAIERIEKIWYCVFMLRIWRDYVLRNKNLNLKDNFLSANCYSCIELNAHSLVLIILHLNQINAPEHFLPYLMNSQPCESLFRQVRSFTSTYSTIANCSVKEILCRISKIQLQNDIMHELSENFEFPRLKTLESKSYPKNLPTLSQIQAEIEKCKKDAFVDAIQLGLIGKTQAKNFDDSCKVIPLERVKKTNLQKKKTDIKQFKFRHDDDLSFLRGTSLKNYAKDFDGKEIVDTSIYVEIYPGFVVKKSSLCWLLRKDCSRISSDRLIRVRSTQKKSYKKVKKFTKKCPLNLAPLGKSKRNKLYRK